MTRGRRGAGCALLPFVLSALLGPPAHAAPSGVRLGVVGDPSTSVGIAWNTPNGTRAALVQHGLDPAALRLETPARLHSWRGRALVAEASLSGLSPRTRYYYRVGDPAGGWSPTYSFQTGEPLHPRCGRLRFVFLGDSRAESWQGKLGASRLWPLLAARALGHLPAFLLHGGDIVHDGKSLRQWENHLLVTEPVSTSVPLLYAMGNHDRSRKPGGAAAFHELFQRPHGGPAPSPAGEDYYAFRYANAIFVVLASPSFAEGTLRAQAEWMDRVLSRNPSRWRFVVLHHPIYTEHLFFNHEGNELGQNAALVPIINKHQVDVVLGSHNHFYERFTASRCSDPGSSTACPVEDAAAGTVYITSGGAGAFPILYPGARRTGRPAASGKHHYLLVEIADHELQLRVLEESGQVIDSLQLSKPATSEPCPAPPPAGRAAAPSSPLAATGGCRCGADPCLALMLLLLGKRRRRASPRQDGSRGAARSSLTESDTRPTIPM